MSQPGPIRDLGFAERSTWGRCVICGAEHGEPCSAEIGIQLGRSASGRQLRTGEGVHLERLRAAPMRVREVET